MLVHRRLPPQLAVAGTQLLLGGEKQVELSVLLNDTEEQIMVTLLSIDPGTSRTSGTLATTPSLSPD